MRKNNCFLIVFLILSIAFYATHCSAHYKSRYGENGFYLGDYEEYSFTFPKHHTNSYDFSDMPQINEAYIQTKYRVTSLLLYHETGLSEKFNLSFDLKIDSINVESEQSINYFHSDFNERINDSFSRITFRAFLAEIRNFGENRYFTPTFGIFFPQIYAGEIYNDTYGFLGGIGYHDKIYGLDVDILPIFGIYPKYSKLYFENDLKVSRCINAKTRLNLRYLMVLNELRIDHHSYYKNLEHYLYSGPINRKLGQMIHDRLFSDIDDDIFHNYQKLGLRITRYLSNQGAIHLDFNKLFQRGVQNQNFEIAIAYSKGF